MKRDVAVIVAAYRSHRTIRATLEALRCQTFGPFETIVVDSSPDDLTALVVERYPWVRLIRSGRRLYPHAARNLGAASTGAGLLVFTDADMEPEHEWLEWLVASHRRTGHPIVGALDCHGSRWVDRGCHLCKFSKWLPGGRPRPVDTAPTAALLLPRTLFDRLGGFASELFLADADLSHKAREAGEVLWFEPRARSDHHHEHGVRSFVRERLRRGRWYGELRLSWHRHDRRRIAWYLVGAVTGARLLRIAALTVLHCARAERLPSALACSPLVAAGHAASLVGEAGAYLAAIGASLRSSIRRVRPA